MKSSEIVEKLAVEIQNVVDEWDSHKPMSKIKYKT